MSRASPIGTISRTNASHCLRGRTLLPGSSAALIPVSRPNIASTRGGDIFVCRVAGNFASDEIVASFEYAVQVLNTPLIVVLGHDACGAVDATAKSIKDGTALPGHLPALVAAISPAVKAVQNEPGDMLDNAIRRNVMLNVEKLRAAGPILNKFIDDKKVRVVGGIYKLASGKVELLV